MAEPNPVRRVALRSRPRAPSYDVRGGQWVTDVLMPAGPSGRRRQAPCAWCGTDRHYIFDPHHVLSKQFLKRAAATLRIDPGDLLWDIRNGMCLCRTCHDKHTHKGERVPLYLIPPHTWEFVRYVDGLLGTEAASVEVERSYAC